jgi:hypothetical protein
MKYTDLTKEQREHFDWLIECYGEPPTKATHFDIMDCYSSSWSRIHAGVWQYWDKVDTEWIKYTPRTLEGAKFVSIPDKPWCCQDDNNPKDVSPTPKPKIRKIVYDRDAFNRAINWILNNSPYAQKDWRNRLPLDVRRWMKDMILRYNSGEIDGVSYISTAGLTLMSSWESDDVLHFYLFADVNVGADCGEYEYDVEDVF